MEFSLLLLQKNNFKSFLLKEKKKRKKKTGEGEWGCGRDYCGGVS